MLLVNDETSRRVHCRGVQLGPCSAGRTYLAASLTPVFLFTLKPSGNGRTRLLYAAWLPIHCGIYLSFLKTASQFFECEKDRLWGRQDTQGAVLLLSEACMQVNITVPARHKHLFFLLFPPMIDISTWAFLKNIRSARSRAFALCRA